MYYQISTFIFNNPPQKSIINIILIIQPRSIIVYWHIDWGLCFSIFLGSIEHWLPKLILTYVIGAPAWLSWLSVWLLISWSLDFMISWFQIMISCFIGSIPTLASVLTTWNLFGIHSVPLSLPLPHLFSLFLSQNK